MLVMEVLYRDVIGLMIPCDLHEWTRPALVRDGRELLAIIGALIEAGVLRLRRRAVILRSIGKHFVVERDEILIACLWLGVVLGATASAEFGTRKIGEGGCHDELCPARGARLGGEENDYAQHAELPSLHGKKVRGDRGG